MYKRILEFWMNEMELKDLQKVTPDFKNEVDKYLEGLGQMENGSPSALKVAEAERVRIILGGISALRKDKICRTKALDGTMESPFDDDICQPSRPEPEQAKDESAKKILVRLLRDVAPFVGADLRTYGPLKSEDVVLLPAQNADALIKRGTAAEIQRKA
jgi:hypothetical protein